MTIISECIKMNTILTLFVCLVVVVPIISSAKMYLNEWSVNIPGGQIAADKFALQNGFVNLGEIVPGSAVYHLRYPRRAKRSLDQDKMILNRLLNHKDVLDAEQLVEKIRVKRDFNLPSRSIRLNDPYWEKMWYLNRGENLDMNVEGAWEEGVTGKGVAVTILDDGIERDHPDLIRSYDPFSSTDINDNDNDPRPRYDYSNSNGHGTRCAGQVAASPNNSLCAVGIAFNAKIGGIRMLDGQVNDAIEARSFSFNPDHVDIYSSSWGPNDDGKTVDGPGRMAMKALKDGVIKGRKGKGSIFVWASGNGGKFKDNCNCDGYVTSIYTITVSSTSESGHIPWYSEACSSTLATTYSSGTSKERQVVTTDLRHGCTAKHTGTSASAPMAAAIVALTLEANPSLTWRDVQHIIVRTARPSNLMAKDWHVNGLGRRVSHSYGFGLMDATAMVKMAKQWINVPDQVNCSIGRPYESAVKINPQSFISIDLDVSKDCHITSLEHIVSPIHVSPGKRRGELRIYLISPLGTRSTLLDNRPKDVSTSGFNDWPFMTVHSWGENPLGRWTLEIHNDAHGHWESDATFYKWSLELYGTTFDPNTEDFKKRNLKVIRNVNSQSTLVPNPNDSSEHEVLIQDGCLSKQGQCVSDRSLCRTFSHSSVARIICQCTQLCTEIDSSTKNVRLQCKQSGVAKRDLQQNVLPSFCHLIPFL